MAETLKDLAHKTIDELLKSMPPEELCKGLSVEERLKGLSPEEIIKALPPEAVEALRRELRGNGSTTAEE